MFYKFRYNLLKVLVLTILTFSLTTPAMAGDQDYKPYSKESRYSTLFEVAYTKSSIEFRIPDGDNIHSVSFAKSNVAIDDDGLVTASSITLFDDSSITVDGLTRLYRDIHDIRIDNRDDTVIIVALQRTRISDSRMARMKRANRVRFEGSQVVDEEEFVRGIVFRIRGDIEIYGEVNKDVVTLFGDIYVGPDAVVRGDIVTTTGRVDVASDASVYGDVFSAKRQKRPYSHRFRRQFEQFQTLFGLGYNRVDGLSAYWGQKFSDPDTYIPSFWGTVGYGLASKRWRFELGLEQALWKTYDLSLTGTYYRRLATDDNWIIENCENSILSILARKDYRDYWESEGSSVSLELSPLTDLQISAVYQYETTKWLDAHHNLWALFGGDPFENNYAMVDSTARETGIAEIDQNTNASLSFGIDYDTRTSRHLFEYSSWHLSAQMEWSHPDLDSDNDYTRYGLSLSRYQKIDRHKMLLLRTVYGDSDGLLPMHKRFYLGGLGTLHGYDHKEFSGSRFALANIELRQAFPRSDLAASLFWDGGLVTDNSDFDDVELKQSLGMSLYLGDDFKISASRRLDRSSENSPEMYVRFEHIF